jgi:hypothetical protein
MKTLIAGVTALMVAAGATQIPIGFTASVTAGPDSLVTVGTQVFASGIIPGDTVLYTFLANGVNKATKRTTALSYKTTVSAPAYGGTIEYKGCVQFERGGRTAVKTPAIPLCWTWNYLRPMPPIVVDSLKQIVLAPPVASLDPLVSLQMCTFGVMKSGLRVKLPPSWNRPECDAAYQSFRVQANT